ncbi:hypothetical protein BJQ89_00626 [Arthrobacter sp. ES1]|nr:hypothetical protein [Arthrobacter sp. ES1]
MGNVESLNQPAMLVARARLVKAVAGSLNDAGTSGALIVGGAGTGKTAVTTAVLHELRDHPPYIRLAATPALAAVPFGVLAPHLAELPARDLDSYPAVLQAMTSRLRSRSGRPLFVVDDAQSLDRGTLHLVAQAVATGAAGLLATSGPGTLIPKEFLALWDDGIVAKYELAALNRSEVHQLCEQVLRCDVSPWVSASFSYLAAGNPFMVLSLIEHCRRTGALALRHGVWLLVAEPVLAGFPEADLVHHQLQRLSSEANLAAALVALAGPLSVGQLLRFSNPKAVDALERAGIIEVSRSGDRRVRPASPLIGEIVRRQIPAGRSARLRGSLLALPGGGQLRPEAFRNQVRWAMDCGARVPAADLLRAARLANVALDPNAALRTAAAVGDESFLPQARLQAAYAQFTSGRPRIASGLLQQATGLHGPDEPYLSALLAARLKAVAAERGSGHAPPLNLGPALLPEPAQPARDGVGDINVFDPSGSLTEVEGRLRVVIEGTGAPATIRIPASSLLALIWSAQGRVLAGRALDQQAWQDAKCHELGLPLIDEDLLMRHCLVLTLAGEWDPAAAAIDDYARAYPPRLIRSGGMLQAMRGFSMIRQGRMPEALAAMSLAAEELKVADPWQLRCFVYSVASYAAAAAGDRDAGHEHLAAFRRLPGGEPLVLRLLVEAYSTVAAGTLARRDSQSTLTALAELARGQGLRGIETEIRRLALVPGDIPGAAALAICSSAVDGPESALVHDFARAVAGSDATGLMRTGDAALAAGYLRLALESAQQAEWCLTQEADHRRLPAVRAQVQQRLAALGMSPQLGFVDPEPAPALTARESEIRGLVSGGASNAEIAALLRVSERSIERHLYRIFARLGVSRPLDLPGPGSVPR